MMNATAILPMESPSTVTKLDLSDEEVLEAVKAILNRHVKLGPLRLDCTVVDGELTIEGQVPLYYHKQLAQTIVSEIRGVTKVVNNICVMT